MEMSPRSRAKSVSNKNDFRSSLTSALDMVHLATHSHVMESMINSKQFFMHMAGNLVVLLDCLISSGHR